MVRKASACFSWQARSRLEVEALRKLGQQLEDDKPTRFFRENRGDQPLPARRASKSRPKPSGNGNGNGTPHA